MRARESCGRQTLHLAGWVLACAVGLGAALPASGATINVSLGNTSSGLTPGQETDLILDVLPAQELQPAPFDQGYGSDLFENFEVSWTFTYPLIADPITAAAIALGMVDADAGSPDNQVAFFSVAGVDLTIAANAAFESVGGDSSVYQVFSIDLASILASLAGGPVDVMLRLKGPVLSPDLFAPPGLVEEDFNGAHLIFSTLSITTASTSVPEPGSLALLGLGLSLLLATRRRARARPS